MQREASVKWHELMRLRRHIPFLIVLVSAAASAAVMQEPLPEGDGKQAVANLCGSCHGIETVTRSRFTREEWSKVVARMIESGARIDGKQREAVLEYLARHLGPTAIDPTVERTATRFIEGICASCHTSELIRTTTATKAEWLEIVKSMNGKGAGLSEPDVDLLADYLFKKYPAK